ncbi:hypothetical protein, partial [Lactobacillus crispatus]
VSKLTVSKINKIISEYSNYPMNKLIKLQIFYDQNKNNTVEVSVTNQDRKIMDKFAEFRHKAYAAYSIFDIENQAFDLLMNQKPHFPPRAPDAGNKLILDYVSDAKVFLDSTRNWIKKNVPDYFDEWDGIRKDLYSTSIAYRICYNLRNYVQHKMYVPINSVCVFSSDFVDYRLDIKNLMNDKQFLNKVELPEDYLKDSNNIYLKKYIAVYHNQIHYLYLLAVRKYFIAKSKKLKQWHDYFAKRKFPSKLYELTTTKNLLFTEGVAEYNLLDTHDTVKNFMDQLVKWGFVDLKDLV